MSFFCPSCYVARHRRCVYVLNLGGTGIGPPDNFSYRSNFRFRSSFRSRSRFRSGSNFRSRFNFSFIFRFSYRSSSSYTTSGDIFYCSGSRQLNHSSYYCYYCRYIICIFSIKHGPLVPVRTCSVDKEEVGSV